MTYNKQQEIKEKFEELSPLQFPLELPGISMTVYEHGCSNCGSTVNYCHGAVVDFGGIKVLDIVTYCHECGYYYDAPDLKFDGKYIYIFDEGQWKPMSPSIIGSLLLTLKNNLLTLGKRILGK